ncbi:hypothetical protein [Bradyrhizobium monzae]|uniref:hypothetical protein n=1 Tax=Bradyrhizobium sp. Oc8 TaxID=2876780 RepID=UPI001F2A18F8|nr:hypothetical protein [Bradyrhizobium sp. Oc8]
MRPIQFNGVSRPLADWARLAGISSDTLTKRLDAGWSVEDALTKPVGKQGRKAMSLPSSSLVHALPALRDWQRDMHAAHRRMTRLARSLIRQMDEQMAELRHSLDQHMAANTPGVGQHLSENANDRSIPSMQDRV